MVVVGDVVHTLGSSLPSEVVATGGKEELEGVLLALELPAEVTEDLTHERGTALLRSSSQTIGGEVDRTAHRS